MLSTWRASLSRLTALQRQPISLFSRGTISSTDDGQHRNGHRYSAEEGSPQELHDMTGYPVERDYDEEETGMMSMHKSQDAGPNLRNTRSDTHIVPDPAAEINAIEGQLVKASLVRGMLINALLIGLWYSFSISISIYNKWMFSKENLDFHFPLFTTSLHMVVQFSLACLVLWMFPRFRPKPAADTLGEYSRVDDGDDMAESSAPPASSRPLMSRWFYLTRIGPCGTATALDIGLGNFSLRFISLTFFTMCKSSVLGFVLLFAFIFRLEQPTWRLCAIILLMTTGVIMMVAGETAFSGLGFVLVMSASFSSGFRWSLTQILLLRNPATSNPFASIFFLTPVMFAALLALALPIEVPTKIIAGVQVLFTQKGVFLGILLLLFPGCLAFMMVAAEFALLQRTSVVTLSVCGIFKEVLTISAAGLVFGDELSPINISGLVVTILSIAAYNYLKYSKMRVTTEEKVHNQLMRDDHTGLSTRRSFELSQDEHETYDAESSQHRRPTSARDSLSLD